MKKLVLLLMSALLLASCAASSQKVPTRTSTTKYVVESDCK